MPLHTGNIAHFSRALPPTVATLTARTISVMQHQIDGCSIENVLLEDAPDTRCQQNAFLLNAYGPPTHPLTPPNTW